MFTKDLLKELKSINLNCLNLNDLKEKILLMGYGLQLKVMLFLTTVELTKIYYHKYVIKI